MGTCKECRWWTRHAYLYRVEHGIQPPHVPCTHPKLTGLERPDSAMGAYKDFHTGPDFGCIHFEPIPPAAE